MTSTGQATLEAISGTSQSRANVASSDRTRSSASMSSDHASASSICLVECGSGSSSPKKNSENPRLSRSHECRL